MTICAERRLSQTAPYPCHQEALAASECQPPNPDIGTSPAWRRHAHRPHGIEHGTDTRAGLDACDSCAAIDGDLVQPAQVNDHAAFAGRMPRLAMTAAPHSDDEARSAPEIDGANDIGLIRTADDRRGSPVNVEIPDAARRVVCGVDG